ncbi:MULTISPECIES: hypothetical protein [unclassified Sphingomonas]|uniref:hypothetical protein n=1 Tax=unclassified Sphingomonas TaxID=196159 RepID=UPI001D0F4C91|nr:MULTISPECIES: hypothetical protein [unclassified Sphingomonas]MCC2979359.1 hypothetical protein [Sphingomonas sp. IC4-52]MCD2315408.1 hypothetical protein [Sphingomonas sp. IC-11]
MSWQIMAMYLVALVFAVTGAGLLLALARPRSEGQVYAFRMIGIMALAGGVVLAMSATAMWQWSVEG